MEALLKDIDALMETFKIDSQLQLTMKNKAEGTRARNAAIELGKRMKEFRKVSLEACK